MFPLPPLFSHLYDRALIEYGVSHGLEVFHAFQSLPDVHVLCVHNTEGGHVHVVVFEILQVKCLNVLPRQLLLLLLVS